MRVLILGGDGYLGWSTALHFSNAGDDVLVVDNYLKRSIAKASRSEALLELPQLPERIDLFQAMTGHRIAHAIIDCTVYEQLADVVREFAPDAIIHYAEQPSAPYSMRGRAEAGITLKNNLDSTHNIVWCMIEHAPKAQLIKLGTMGEYGTPNIDIEEGWIDIQHKGRSDRFLYPRKPGSLYHTSKVLDTDLLWFYVRNHGLSVTDLMQGPVYGIATDQTVLDDRLSPHFHYDDIFGTVVNRFVVQAVAGIPLTVYGRGGQKRGFLNLRDTLQCVDLVARNPSPAGEFRVLNQFTEQFRITDIAERVKDAAEAMGIKVQIQTVENPRVELEEHYYNPQHTGLLELGLKPHFMTQEVLVGMLEFARRHAERIDPALIYPRVKWR